MSNNAHPRPEQIRARLSHPVVDADGHWLHYGPVFREEIRKVGGDAALEGVLSVSKGTREALSRHRNRRGEICGHGDMDQAAAEAVRRWRFEPGRRGDEAIGMWVWLPIEFRIK